MLFTHYSLLITYHLLKGRLYMKEYKIELTVNDEKISAVAKPEESLLKYLRRNGFTEVKCGCEKGECGTCTVILNKKAVKSCIVLALQANHKEVWTVKGMEKMELGRKLQESFVNHGAIQCGFCTAGMILTAKDYMEKIPFPIERKLKKQYLEI